MSTPPSKPASQVPIINRIRILHRDLYLIGLKFGKREKLGIHSTVEKYCIEILSLAIESAFQINTEKVKPLERLRINLGIIQNLVRTENELEILNEKEYIRISAQLVEISKSTNNWLNYVAQKGL
jgi:hypothetical protein